MTSDLASNLIEGSQLDESTYLQKKTRSLRPQFCNTVQNTETPKGGGSMLLNVILVTMLFAVFGATAHRIMGGGGSLLHLVFVGGCGYLLSDTVRTLFSLHSIGIFWVLGMDIAASCIVIWIIRAIQVYLIRQRIRSYNDKDT